MRLGRERWGGMSREDEGEEEEEEEMDEEADKCK